MCALKEATFGLLPAGDKMDESTRLVCLISKHLMYFLSYYIWKLPPCIFQIKNKKLRFKKKLVFYAELFQSVEGEKIDDV